MRINAEDAAKHGLTEGVLVLESTLAATPSSSQEALTGDTHSPQGQAVSVQICVLCHVHAVKLGTSVAEMQTMICCCRSPDMLGTRCKRLVIIWVLRPVHVSLMQY